MNTLFLRRFTIHPVQLQQWTKVLLYAIVLFALYSYVLQAQASDGEEFAEAADKFELWVRGNLGKLAALVALAIGMVVAAIKKDWTWFFGSIIIALGVGILVGIINASFTALI